MPLHDLRCPTCETEHRNVYIPMDKIDDRLEECTMCGEFMEIDYRRQTKRSTRSHKFPEFTLDHTVRVTGEKQEIHSVADIRALEKKHRDINLCVEAFSYDNERGDESPVAKAEPVHMSEQQKRDFVDVTTHGDELNTDCRIYASSPLPNIIEYFDVIYHVIQRRALSD